MSTTPQGTPESDHELPIVVGVDGSESSRHALDWAAAEAASCRCPLRLVYAFQPTVQRVPALPVSTQMVVHKEGKHILTAAERHLRNTGRGDLDQVGILQEGSPAHVLLRLASRARMLVIGRRGRGQFAALALGSTASACASRARIPLVVVPSGSRRKGAGENAAPVVIGVDGTTGCDSALEFGFDWAARHAAPVHAIFCWELSNPFTASLSVIHAETAREEAEARRTLEASLTQWRSKYPEVEVTASTERIPARQGLLLHAANAALLVIGGRRRTRLGAAVFGTIARATVNHAPCPVALVRTS